MKKSEPIIANYDGTIANFTRDWLKIIGQHGAKATIDRLTDIRDRVRSAAVDLQDILNRNPYFAGELRAIIDNRAESSALVGTLDDYITSLKALPPNPTNELINLLIQAPEKKLEDGARNYSDWIGRFNSKDPFVKDELAFLRSPE